MVKLLQSKAWGSLLLLVVLSLTSCLKDKDYDNGVINTITGRTATNRFVSIPLAINKPNVVGLEAKSGFQDINLFRFSYDNATPATEEITVKVTQNDALITALDPTVILLPSSAVQIVSLTHKFKVGQVISDPFVIKLNTDLLDPTKKYGIAFSIVEVSGGIQIPSNLKDALFVFTIKNKYDGIYKLTCRMAHPADRSPDWPRTPWTYAYDIHMITTGPRSVRMFNTAFNAGFHPLQTPGASGFGQTEPNFEFDASDKITRVFNGIAATNGRTFLLNPDVTDSRYDGASKTIFAAILMTQTGFQNIPIFDTLRFQRARP
jgi:hypothetical protein